MLYKTTIPLSTQIVSIVVSDLALTTSFDTIRHFLFRALHLLGVHYSKTWQKKIVKSFFKLFLIFLTIFLFYCFWLFIVLKYNKGVMVVAMIRRKLRMIYGVSFILVLSIEICIALFIRDSFIRPYVGDMLVTVLICCFVRFVFPE